MFVVSMVDGKCANWDRGEEKMSTVSVEKIVD